jgi:hypothetical protein
MGCIPGVLHHGISVVDRFIAEREAFAFSTGIMVT